LRNAEPDTAIAAGDDGHAAGKIENVHEAFPFPMSCASMDKRVPKIKYGANAR
jgi:hypothetical protein